MKGVCQSYLCHPAYLTFMQNTSRKITGWRKIKLELRLTGEMSITTDVQMTSTMAESEEELKSLLMRVKDENEKADFKLNIQKTRIMASGPITSWQMLFSLLKLMTIESVVPSNYPIICHPLPLLPSIFPSIRVFSNESSLHLRRSKYWSFSFSISSSSECTGLVSFRVD